MTNRIIVFRCLAPIVLLSCGTLCAQDQDPVPPADPKPATQSATPPEGTAPAPLDKRIFAVLPNYRTADGNLPYEPISSKRKLWIGFKDSFDYPIFITSAIYSSFYQLQDSHPQFGQGMEGYAKRYLASSTDLVVGNFMSESIFPILLKEDPRYFAVGPAYGGVWKRAGYALTRVLVCKTDTGKATFNYSEILGNSTAVALSNVYYSDTRDARDAAQALGTQVATDALSNLLKEFWPDVKRKFFNKKSTPAND